MSNPQSQIEQYDGKSDFLRWLKRFERYRIISGLRTKSIEAQVNTLIYSIGPSAEDVLESFRLTPAQQKDYDLLVDKFTKHYVPKVNVIFERARFNRRIQQEGESVEDFIADLNPLSQNCGYKELRDELIRDQIVIGIRDQALSERLQLDPDLTLEKAINACRQTETLRKNMSRLNLLGNQEIEKVTKSDRGKKIRNKEQGYSRKNSKLNDFVCTRCGSTESHRKRSCPAYNETCFKCRKRGHFASVCRSMNE